MRLPAPLEGWEASIWCRGRKLGAVPPFTLCYVLTEDEYQIVTIPATDTEPITLRCFVEATEGEEFQMVTAPPLSSTSMSHDVSIGYTVDGHGLGRTAIHGANEPRPIIRGSIYLPSSIGFREARLKFASLNVTDLPLPPDRRKFEQLGSLCLSLRLGKAKKEFVALCPTGTLSSEDVPEKAKKSLVDQRVAVGDTTAAPDTLTLTEFEFFDRIKDAVKVVFMYRSKRILQATDVIPRDPSEEASTGLQNVDVDIKDETEVELGPLMEGRAAKKRILALEAEVARLRKRMRGARTNDHETEIGTSEARAIDLTED